MAHKILKLHDGRILKDYVNESVIPAKELEW
jgi:putative ABC transport system ATP-binding protein